MQRVALVQVAVELGRIGVQEPLAGALLAPYADRALARFGAIDEDLEAQATAAWALSADVCGRADVGFNPHWPIAFLAASKLRPSACV